MSRPKVVVTRRWPAACEQALRETFEVVLNESDEPFSKAQYQDALCGADALFPTVTDKLTAEVLAVEPGAMRARLLGNFGVGFNNIDVEAAKSHGLTVTNTPDVLTDATADLAMTLLLMTARRAGEGERMVRAGEWTGWRPTQLLGTEVSGATLGVVGMGRIGVALARRAYFGFGMRIRYYNLFDLSDEQKGGMQAERVEDLDELLAGSDFVSLHCPATPETYHLIDAARLRAMPSQAILINTARGDVVDEAALIEALRDGQIAAAGLDVFEREPEVSAGLLTLENAVLLPHLGSATEQTRVAMGMRVIDNARAFFAGETPPDRVA